MHLTINANYITLQNSKILAILVIFTIEYSLNFTAKTSALKFAFLSRTIRHCNKLLLGGRQYHVFASVSFSAKRHFSFMNKFR